MVRDRQRARFLAADIGSSQQNRPPGGRNPVESAPLVGVAVHRSSHLVGPQPPKPRRVPRAMGPTDQPGL